MQTATRKTRRLAVAATTAAVAAALALGVLGLRHSTAGEKPNAAPPAIPVSVAAVESREITAWEEFSGRLEAVERVDVRSRVAGAVQSVQFNEGALVRAGDPLVTIDPAPYVAEVERAQAQVVAAQARLAHAVSEHERSQRLWQEQAIAQRELDERVNGRREAEANVRAAEAALHLAQLNLGYTQVRAPVSGRVGRLEVTVGNLVPAGPGAPVLTTLVSVNPIYASFDADENVVARALQDLPKAGDRAGLALIPVQIGTAESEGTPLNGKLQLVDNQVNVKSGTVRVRAIFDNKDGALTPGQFVKVRMGRARSENGLLVSERAVGTDQSKKFVMVVGPDKKTAYREVVLGASFDGLRVVTAGLQPGERIVVNGLQRVRPGSLVAPQTVKMASR
jgi:membrane fusion protein, multidrug efflux system